MKKTFVRFLMMVTIGFTFLNGSCDKDNDPGKVNDPPIAVNSSRFLCTIGIATDDGKSDTLIYRFDSGAELNMGPYVTELAEEKDMVMVESGGSNSNVYRIVFNTGYNWGTEMGTHIYLGISDKLDPTAAQGAIGCDYKFVPKKIIGDDTDFIIVGDANGFTVESKSHPGHYLQPGKWKNATSPMEAMLVFCRGSHSFFLLDK